MTDQHRNIVGALPQRRHLQRDDVQAVIEILSESPLPHALRQVDVRRCNHANIDFNGFGAAQALYLPILQNAQQFQPEVRGGMSPISSRNKVLLCSLLKAADPITDGAGKRAFGMAEQLRFEQIFRQRAAIDRDHPRLRARAGHVQRAGGHFLTRSRFSANEHRAAPGPDQADGLRHRFHGETLSDQEFAPCFARIGPALSGFVANAFFLDSMVNSLAHRRQAIARVEAMRQRRRALTALPLTP